MARPSKLTEELAKKAQAYIYVEDQGEPFGVCAGFTTDGSVIPTIEGLASYLGIHRDTVYAWCKTPTTPDEGSSVSLDEHDKNVVLHQEFSDIVSEVKNQQAIMLINGSLSNKYNASIAKLILSGKHGYVEKSEQDITTKGESINNDIPVNEETRKKFLEFMLEETKG